MNRLEWTETKSHFWATYGDLQGCISVQKPEAYENNDGNARILFHGSPVLGLKKKFSMIGGAANARQHCEQFVQEYGRLFMHDQSLVWC